MVKSSEQNMEKHPLLSLSIVFSLATETRLQIPVGCVPPAHRPYLPACYAWGVYLVRGAGGVPGPGGCTWPCGGVYLVPMGGVPGPGGCTLVWGGYLVRGVYTGRGGVYLVRYSPPPVNRITHTCKNHNLAPTSLRAVTMSNTNAW